MQAILTRVIPATNTKPTRIKAICARGSLTMAYDGPHQLGSDLAHAEVARALCSRFAVEDMAQYGPKSKSAWDAPFVTGCLKNGDFAHVFLAPEAGR